LRVKNAPLLALASLAILGLARAQDDKKEKPVQESALESSDARGTADKLQEKLGEESWKEAWTAANELLEKRADDLLLLDNSKEAARTSIGGLHATAARFVRQKLAGISDAGKKALAKAFNEKEAEKLQTALKAGDPIEIEKLASRWFPLDEGGRALLTVGTIERERGCLVGAALAWKDVLELHSNRDARTRAAKLLLEIAPALGDETTAHEIASLIRSAELPTGEKLEAAAEKLADKLADAPTEDYSVDDSGGLAPVFSAVEPSAKQAKCVLASHDSKDIDWRTAAETTNRWGQNVPPMRRLFFGHAAAHDTLLVHLGRAIYAYDADSGERQWIQGSGNIPAYMKDLLASGILARYGTCIKKKHVYATLRAAPIDDDGKIPRGKLVAFRIDTGKGRGDEKVLWDTLAGEPEEETPKKKKKKEKKEDDKEELKLSYTGTPVHGGRFIYCPAANAASPNETYVAAVSSADGSLVWKRALATSSPFAPQNNPWEATYPRPMPTPALAIIRGTLVALSNNGCLAALDPVDGHVLWARTYERDEDQQGAKNPWRIDPKDIVSALNRGYNPPLPLGDGVLVLPSDSKKMQIVRLMDGTIATGKPHDRKNYDYLVGVYHGKVILAGEKAVETFPMKRGKRVSLEPGDTAIFEKDKVVGRSALVNGVVYVPTSKRLISVSVEDGKKQTIVEWEDAPREMGDLVIGSGRFFTVGARYAHSFGEE